MTDAPVDRGAGDAGTTLIEVLMAVILVGTAFVALLSGFGTVAIGSNIHRQQADAEVVLTSAVERLKDPAVEHVPCADAGTTTYLDAVRSATVPTGWVPAATITIPSVAYWDGTGFTPTCHDTPALGHVLTLQEITVEVVSPDGRATESVSIVKGPVKVASP